MKKLKVLILSLLLALTFGCGDGGSGSSDSGGSDLTDNGDNNSTETEVVFTGKQKAGPVYASDINTLTGNNYNFGSPVAISGDYAIVGTKSGVQGCVYILERGTDGTWEYANTENNVAGKLETEQVTEYKYGISVDIDGDLAIVAESYGSAYIDDGNGSTTEIKTAGVAYIYKRTYDETAGENIWKKEAILQADNCEASDRFGESVAISGDYAIVTAKAESGENNSVNKTGAAYVFKRTVASDGTVSWTQKQILRAVDEDGASIEKLYLGKTGNPCLSMEGNYVIIGAPSYDTPNKNNGIAFIFERNPNIDSWSQKAILTDDSLEKEDEFGTTVSISGNYAMVGLEYRQYEDGKVFVYERGTDGEWSKLETLTCPETWIAGTFGASVSISGDYAVIGHDCFAVDAGAGGYDYVGAAFVYERGTDGWEYKYKLSGSDPEDGCNFGYSVAIDGTYVIVGADEKNYYDDGNDDDAGAVYFFE